MCNKFLIKKFAEISPTQYFDPRSLTDQKDFETIVATTANLEISPNTVDTSEDKNVNSLYSLY
jgi:hypothetical protein